MARQLVIVESPGKAETLTRLLGGDFLVSTFRGRVRDWPRGRLAVDTQRGFVAEYEIPPSRRRELVVLRKAARECEGAIHLAADPDHDGEDFCAQIADQLAEAVARRPFVRVVLDELTPLAVEGAFAAPRGIDARKVDARETRRILDRLVGHGLRGLLGGKGHSDPWLGLPQAVALRILCDREREIEAFVPREQWKIRAHFEDAGSPVLVAQLVEAGGSNVRLTDAPALRAVAETLQTARFRVGPIREHARHRSPPPPFVTATLQEEAFRTLRFPVRKTMQVAKRLYEGVDLDRQVSAGLITYPHTDLAQVTPDAARAAREAVAQRFGSACGTTPLTACRASRPALHGREAIRPTDLLRTPETIGGRLNPDELALYRLVYERFLVSQMAAAVYDERIVEIEAHAMDAPAGGGSHRLRSHEMVLRSPGFLAASPTPVESQAIRPLPLLREGATLELRRVETASSLSAPPPRFTEATLVEELEGRGIGRPSTYAAILAALDSRDHVSRQKREMKPTPLGRAAGEFLAACFPDLVSSGRAAAIEALLDGIEEDRATRLGTLATFWREFEPALTAARRRAPRLDPTSARTPTRESSAPRPPRGISCPRCHEGRVVQREKEGRTFFGCTRFPACRFTSNRRPVAESCPSCGRAFLLEKETKREGRILYCANESCRYRRQG